jgi:hypothetical protein
MDDLRLQGTEVNMVFMQSVLDLAAAEHLI